MPSRSQTATCHGFQPAEGVRAGRREDIQLSVLAENRQIRPSRNSRRRAAVLIGVHLLIVAHVAHWLLRGRTLSPVEPSEAMYTLDNGYLNAGFIFFAVTILATLVFGRYFCGWGCHLVAYQDLCAWLLRKVGIRPRPFRSRILVLAPLALAFYMFAWPSVYRWIAGHPSPPISNHLMTSEFWKTFPGLGIAILTFAVCGFIIVYFLGGKGFCTYACPYGGFFGVADRLAAGRILVTDACEQCGHCTATCTSNVRVHEEVARFGMVVDPGCMKCMDCVSVCPNDALYFGFARPPALGGQKLRAGSRQEESGPSKNGASEARYDFTLAEELAMVAIGLAALLAFRGLYNQIPLLLAMGMAAITSFLTLKLWHVLRLATVRLQNLQLKRAGRISRAGVVFSGSAVTLLVFAAHSGAVQYNAWRGRTLFESIAIADEVWLPGNAWWEKASPADRDRVETALGVLSRVDRWGLMVTPAASQQLLWLHLAKGDVAAAESVVRRLSAALPQDANVHRGLAGVLRKAGRFSEAEDAYRESLRLDPGFDRARLELAAMLVQTARPDAATAEYRLGIQHGSDRARFAVELGRALAATGRPEEAQRELAAFTAEAPDAAAVWAELGVIQLRQGRSAEGIAHLRRAIDVHEGATQVHYNLAMALLAAAERGDKPDAPGAAANARIAEAIDHLERVISDQPRFAEAHYNLGVAKFMSARPTEAADHVRESLRLAPGDPQAEAFLQMLAPLIDQP